MEREIGPGDPSHSKIPTPLAEQLWTEHGWAMRGRHLAILLATIAVASLAVEFVGTASIQQAHNLIRSSTP